MTGRCHFCRAKTMATKGSEERESRKWPTTGFKHGWVVEKATVAYLVCVDCVSRTLLAAA